MSRPEGLPREVGPRKLYAGDRYRTAYTGNEPAYVLETVWEYWHEDRRKQAGGYVNMRKEYVLVVDGKDRSTAYHPQTGYADAYNEGYAAALAAMTKEAETK